MGSLCVQNLRIWVLEAGGLKVWVWGQSGIYETMSQGMKIKKEIKQNRKEGSKEERKEGTEKEKWKINGEKREI